MVGDIVPVVGGGAEPDILDSFRPSMRPNALTAQNCEPNLIRSLPHGLFSAHIYLFYFPAGSQYHSLRHDLGHWHRIPVLSVLCRYPETYLVFSRGGNKGCI